MNFWKRTDAELNPNCKRCGNTIHGEYWWRHKLWSNPHRGAAAGSLQQILYGGLFPQLALQRCLLAWGQCIGQHLRLDSYHAVTTNVEFYWTGTIVAAQWHCSTFSITLLQLSAFIEFNWCWVWLQRALVMLRIIEGEYPEHACRNT